MSDSLKDGVYAAFAQLAKGLSGREDRFVAVIILGTGGILILLGTYVSPSLSINLLLLSIEPHAALIGTGTVTAIVTVPYLLLAEIISAISKFRKQRQSRAESVNQEDNSRGQEP